MVVVAILGVLAISVLAIYQDLTTRARQAADDGTLGALRSAVALFIAGNGFPPPDQAVLDTLVKPSPPVFLFYTGYDYDPGSGTVTAKP
jgi:type II secretory pathway pseudopilin PulG